MKGANNPFYGKSLSQKTLDAAVEVNATKVFVYTEVGFKPVEGSPFGQLQKQCLLVLELYE